MLFLLSLEDESVNKKVTGMIHFLEKFAVQSCTSSMLIKYKSGGGGGILNYLIIK